MELEVGQSFDRWTVLETTGRMVMCRCDCGTERPVVRYSLFKGESRSCGCLSREMSAQLMRERATPIAPGQRFSRWTVIDVRGGVGLTQPRVARCRCDCGTERTVVASNLIQGVSRSCGCLALEARAANGRANKKHGFAHHPLYHVWKALMRRCTNPSAHDWKDYGGRGIVVYQGWSDLTTFIRDVERELGPRPPGFTLDRINNESGYEPGNIRWATRREQALNRRSRGRNRTPVAST